MELSNLNYKLTGTEIPFLHVMFQFIFLISTIKLYTVHYIQCILQTMIKAIPALHLKSVFKGINNPAIQIQRLFKISIRLSILPLIRGTQTIKNQRVKLHALKQWWQSCFLYILLGNLLDTCQWARVRHKKFAVTVLRCLQLSNPEKQTNKNILKILSFLKLNKSVFHSPSPTTIKFR